MKNRTAVRFFFCCLVLVAGSSYGAVRCGAVRISGFLNFIRVVRTVLRQLCGTSDGQHGEILRGIGRPHEEEALCPSRPRLWYRGSGCIRKERRQDDRKWYPVLRSSSRKLATYISEKNKKNSLFVRCRGRCVFFFFFRGWRRFFFGRTRQTINSTCNLFQIVGKHKKGRWRIRQPYRRPTA